MELVLYPSDILKRTSKVVNVEDPGFDPIEMKKLMVDTMLQNNGIGLSANQVNVDYQLFVMGSDSQSAEISGKTTQGEGKLDKPRRRT